MKSAGSESGDLVDPPRQRATGKVRRVLGCRVQSRVATIADRRHVTPFVWFAAST